MFPVPIKNNTLVALSGPGLNGWFGRLVKRVIEMALGAIGEVPIIGGTIQKELTAAIDKWTGSYGGEFWKAKAAPEFEPNAVESAIIQNWSTAKMIPFYKVLTQQVSDAFANPDFDAQLSQINAAIMKMCVLRKYFATNETGGLSPDAVMSRMEIINGIFLPLEELIAKSTSQYETVISQQDYVVTISSTHASQFKKIAALTIGQTYSCKQFVDTNVKNNAPGATTSPTVTVPGTTTPTTPASASNKPLLTTKNIVLGLGLLYLGYELTKDDKKKK